MATKAGKKNEGFIPLADWSEADQALAAISRMRSEVAAEKARLDRKTEALRGDYEARTKPLLEAAAHEEKRLAAFTRERRTEMEPKKSRQLTFGLVKLYLGKPYVHFIKSKKHTLELLLKLRFKKFIRWVPEPNVEKMKALMTADQLAQVKAKLRQDEEFSYELADDAQAQPKPGAGI